MGCLVRSLIMLVLPFALFWVPVPGLGGFLAGLIGGYLSGSPGRAVASALLPFVVIAAVIVALGFHFDLPLVGSVVAGIALVLLILHDLALLAGAVVGGFLRSRSTAARPAESWRPRG